MANSLFPHFFWTHFIVMHLWATWVRCHHLCIVREREGGRAKKRWRESVCEWKCLYIESLVSRKKVGGEWKWLPLMASLIRPYKKIRQHRKMWFFRTSNEQNYKKYVFVTLEDPQNPSRKLLVHGFANETDILEH